MSANSSALKTNPFQPEDPREYAELLAGFTAEYTPCGGLEQELVRQITSAAHRLRRLDRVENAAMAAESIEHTRDEGGAASVERFNNIAALLARIGRARTQAERAFNRAYKDLEDRRACRAAAPAPAEVIEMSPVQNKARIQPPPEKQIKPSRSVVARSEADPRAHLEPSRLQSETCCRPSIANTLLTL
jgi:hypothetical protein